MNFEPNWIFHVFWAVFGHDDDQSFKIEENISNRVRKLKTILNAFTCTLLVEMMDSSESE